jgi:hypothetical protein
VLNWEGSLANSDRQKTGVALSEAEARLTHSSREPSASASAEWVRHQQFFQALWLACTVLLALSVGLLGYSAAWEYSTREYLKGFSDAIIPAEFSPIEKIQSILDWMSRGPTRQSNGPAGTAPVRSPRDTLNYASLLNVCGTATNAFINLADSAGLSARRLLLLDSREVTQHVVAEVFIQGRWIIVDPVFRFIPRGPGGSLLTRQDLANPATFAAVTGNIPNYNPAYNYQNTAHVHLARIPYLGGLLNRTLKSILPGWSDSSVVSLLFERNSFALLIVAIALVLTLGIFRAVLSWYGRARMGIDVPHVRTRALRAYRAFFEAPD